MTTETLLEYLLTGKHEDDETLSIHPLVQTQIRFWLRGAKQISTFTGEALQLLAEHFPTGEHENREECEKLLPHAVTLLKYGFGTEMRQLDRA